MKKIFFALISILSVNFVFSQNVGDIIGPKLYEFTLIKDGKFATLPDVKNFAEKLGLELLSKTKENMVKYFCFIMDKYAKDISSNTLEFDPRKSLFLKTLCNFTGLYPDGKFAEKISLNDSKQKYFNLISQNIEDLLTNQNSIANDCYVKGINPIKGSLNNIDFACVGKKIFDFLANDISNIMTAKAYGYFADEEEFKTWQKNTFKSMCKDFNYISATKTSNVSLCNHPLTYQYLKDISSKAKSILNNLNLIVLPNSDIQQFLKNLGYDLAEKGQISLFVLLKNQIYNELYFYNIFLEYYKLYLQNMPSQGNIVSVGTNLYRNFLSPLNNQINQIEYYQNLSQSSLQTTFLIVHEIYLTFPIHIGFMIILEDLNAFRHALAKIYTPLDQLRYKLKNVQDLDKK